MLFLTFRKFATKKRKQLVYLGQQNVLKHSLLAPTLHQHHSTGPCLATFPNLGFRQKYIAKYIPTLFPVFENVVKHGLW